MLCRPVASAVASAASSALALLITSLLRLGHHAKLEVDPAGLSQSYKLADPGGWLLQGLAEAHKAGAQAGELRSGAGRLPAWL